MTLSPAQRGASLAVLAFAVFSSHDAVIKLLGDQYSVIQIMFFSVLFGFPPMAMEMSSERALDNFRPHNPLLLALRATLMLISMVTIFYAFTVIPLAQVYAILFATPLLVTILAVPLLGEEVRLRRWVAVGVGLIGFLVVVRPGAATLELGHLAALIGAVSNAFGAILVRRIGKTERSVVLILYPMAATLLIMAVLLPSVYQPMPLHHLALCAVVGLLAFTGQMLNVSAFKTAPIGIVAPMQYSQILWASLFGLLFFDEAPDIWTGLGATIIIGSGLYIVWRETGTSASDQRPVTRTVNLRPDAGASPDPKGKALEGEARP